MSDVNPEKIPTITIKELYRKEAAKQEQVMPLKEIMGATDEVVG